LDATHPLADDKTAQCLACVVVTVAALCFGRIDPTQADVHARPAVRANLDVIPIDGALCQANKFSGIAGRDGGDEKRQNCRSGQKPYRHSARRRRPATCTGDHSPPKRLDVPAVSLKKIIV
jgi:hypothetical protein